MSRRRKRQRDTKHVPPSQARDARASGRGNVLAPEGSEGSGPWIGQKRPVLRFVVLVGVLMGLYYAGTRSETYQERFFRHYLDLNASISAGILRGLGHDAQSTSLSVTSPDFGFSIQKGCDAIDPSALFAACVVALQAPWRRKVVGLVVGVTALLLINFIRIISLFYTGLYFSRETFEIMHVDVWQPVFIVLAVTFWGIWAVRATEPVASPESDVSA